MELSLQFLDGSSVVIRSIGMTHLTSSHSGKYIADKIFDQLALFDIKVFQIVSITTDNASNMLSMINRCNDMYTEEIEDTNDEIDNADVVDIDEQDDGGDEVDNATHVNVIATEQYCLALDADVTSLISDYLYQIELEEVCAVNTLSIPTNQPTDRIARIEMLLRDVEDIFANQTININGIRCAAHTLQLAVMKALKFADFQIVIRLTREVCKELRKPSNIY